MELVVLVNEQDVEIGVMEKLEAHQKSLLHRAFSVFVFDDKQQLILQKRNPAKYHSGGLWTNTCCGHPRPNEAVKSAAERRLFEEMGFTIPLEEQFHFIYKASFSNGLTEHELDYVFFGQYSGSIVPNSLEVSEVHNMPLKEVKHDVLMHPDRYTEWFKICLDEVIRNQKNYV